MSKKNSYIQVRVSEEFKNKVEYVCYLEYTSISALVTRLLAQYVINSDFDSNCFDAWLSENGKN